MSCSENFTAEGSYHPKYTSSLCLVIENAEHGILKPIPQFPIHPKEEEPQKKKSLGKRKRKTEQELAVLRSEFKKDHLWDKEKVAEIAVKCGLDEAQVYKWWWDQTRKRAKLAVEEGSDLASSPSQLLPFIDEFGGYSSRIRTVNPLYERPTSAESAAAEEDDFSLSRLLGIDIEQKAKCLVSPRKN